MKERKFLPTIEDLIDRLTIFQLKEVKIPEHKEKYAKDIQDILNDIDIILKESPGEVNAKLLRAVIVLAQMNTHIWYNESDVRNGVKGSDNLMLTHGLNGIRNTAKNFITDILGGRKDHKIDCLAADFKDWEVSWNEESK
tara:strand:- start:223 stop:642 length:420 start_codon:yes stop_codon:yes gene_type:complete